VLVQEGTFKCSERAESEPSYRLYLGVRGLESFMKFEYDIAIPESNPDEIFMYGECCGIVKFGILKKNENKKMWSSNCNHAMEMIDSELMDCVMFDEQEENELHSGHIKQSLAKLLIGEHFAVKNYTSDLGLEVQTIVSKNKNIVY